MIRVNSCDSWFLPDGFPDAPEKRSMFVGAGRSIGEEAEADRQRIAEGLPFLGRLEFVVFAHWPEYGLVRAEDGEPLEDARAEILVDVAGAIIGNAGQLRECEGGFGRLAAGG